jgi:predicted NBD/HSP70 family sugar kinase
VVTTALARRTEAVRADQTSVRRANLGVVLRHVAAHAPCSRASVAARTGLTRGTVSSLVTELLELGLLRESGIAEPPRVGRPSVSLELGESVVGVGLEVNVDYLAVCVEDLRGGVRYERRVLCDNRSSSVAPVIARLARLANEALEMVELEGLQVAGIAVAVPGLVDAEREMLLRAPNLGWSEVPVGELLGAKLNTARVLHVENESNAAALAEHWRGAGQGLRSFICVFGEIGVGGGIYVDGELFRGGRGYGGEIGHTLIDPDGALCACGNRGCLETVIGQEAIARAAGIVPDSSDRAASLTEELVERATANDPLTLTALASAAESLGIALASTINLLDLDGVVLAGCFGPLAPWLAEGVETALETRVLSAEWSSCEVRASTLGERAAVHGAAAIILRSVLTDPWSARRRGDDVRVAAS